MKRKIFITVMLILGLFLNAQKQKVGINTSNPTETLDVNGKTYTNSLYLRDPGEPTQSGGHFLATSDNALHLYDPTIESSGLFNYLKLTLTGVSRDGVLDYDTKIDAENFLVVLHNFSYQLHDGTTNVMLDYQGNGANNSKQGSPEFIAFKSNGTWHLIARFTESKLMPDIARTSYNKFKVDLYLMVYKKSIIKHKLSDIIADLGGTDGSSMILNVPDGF